MAKILAGSVDQQELSTNPSTPASGYTKLYPKTDHRMYMKDSTGTETLVGPLLAGAGLALTGQTLSIGVGGVTSNMIADGAITDTDVASANKDGAAATPSLRTLGTGAAQACAGNDSRLSNARTPTAHATTHQSGGSDVLGLDATQLTGGTLAVARVGSSPAATTYLKGAASGSASWVGASTVKIDLSLDQVNNTSDANKPVSTATQSAINAAQAFAAPTGMISMFGGSTAPSGWAFCDGSSQLRTDPTYSALYQVIGITYGSADGTHFNLPNLQGRFALGSGTATGSGINAGARVLGVSSGSDTISSAQLPTHTHSTPNHNHTFDKTNSATGSSASTFAAGTATVSANSAGIFNPANSGGGTSGDGGFANNIFTPAHTVVNYIVKL